MTVGPPQAHRVRPRRGRRLIRALALAVALGGLGLAVLWVATPGVGDAPQLVRERLAAHDGQPVDVLPRQDRVAQALLATEDSRFYQTPGVDPISVVRAGYAFVVGSPDVGGATLEQQLAKNLYYDGRLGLLAQVGEVGVALKLDAYYSKAQVLQMYLSEVYLGHGFYGLPQAAQGYFGVDPAQLTWAQASMVAGLVQAPSAYDPITHPSAAKLRQRHVLNRLVATGVLTSAQAHSAFLAPLRLR